MDLRCLATRDIRPQDRAFKDCSIKLGPEFLDREKSTVGKRASSAAEDKFSETMKADITPWTRTCSVFPAHGLPYERFEVVVAAEFTVPWLAIRGHHSFDILDVLVLEAEFASELTGLHPLVSHQTWTRRRGNQYTIWVIIPIASPLHKRCLLLWGYLLLSILEGSRTTFLASSRRPLSGAHLSPKGIRPGNNVAASLQEVCQKG